ncbi:hypothetical protein [Mesorhizobium sp. B4-1-1]|uniref:hypothetical protein n=1 Tax=Mesorhizobium sp. B4-1-1 TaxID=2589890 RepID=UPI001FED3E0F|nr:hypothetical protein [Mesorhizobium sp. B4-1-1]
MFEESRLAVSAATRLPYSRHVADVQARWIGPAKPIETGPRKGEPLPLVVFEAPCL